MVSVSIIVSVCNTPPDALRHTLWAATHQTFRSDQFEVIIVDDGSSDPSTAAVLTSFSSGNLPCRVIRHDQHLGTLAARRTGAVAAIGQFVIFLDGDETLARDTAESLWYRARKLEADVVTAPSYLWDDATKSYRPITLSRRRLPTERAELFEAVFAARADLSMSGNLIARELLTEDVFAFPERTPLGDLTAMSIVLQKARLIGYHRQFYCYRTRRTGPFDAAQFADHISGLQFARERWRQIASEEIAAGALGTESFGWIDEGLHRLADAILAQVDATAPADSEVRRLALSAATEFAEPAAAELNSRTEGEHSISGGPEPESIQSRDVAAWLLRRDDAYRRQEGRGLRPSQMATRLAGKTVLVCQANYHLRAAIAFAAELERRGHRCAVVDNSTFLADGKRASTETDLRGLGDIDYVAVETEPYKPDSFATARFVAVFNDFTPAFREALEYRHRLGLPIAGIVEGINDFERIDFSDDRFLSYRRCDDVFTAGDDDARFFEDRNVYMVGLPRIEDLAALTPVFPGVPLVALNMNFSYRVLLPDTADKFLATARTAFAKAGVEWAVTQHPMDDTAVDPDWLYNGTQYELINSCTVFVSRFATGMLEALASGKPVVYFKPAEEVVDKFTRPLGAFTIANDEGQLAAQVELAIAEADAGVDFRERAAAFLQLHTGWSATQERTSADRFADAVESIVRANQELIEKTESMLDDWKAPSNGADRQSTPADAARGVGSEVPIETEPDRPGAKSTASHYLRKGRSRLQTVVDRLRSNS